MAEAGARGLTFGLSGVVDSAVVAGLCSLAMPGHVSGLIIPCGRDPDDEAENEADARLVANGFNIPVARLNLAPAFDALTGGLETALAPRPGTPSSHGGNERQERAALANVKPRLRMTSLYLVANRSLERYLRDGPDGVRPALVLRIERLIRATEHKRAPLPMPGTD